MTSGDVTIAYLKTHYPDKSIFLAGVPELEDDFKKAGLHLTDDQADIVVVAFDQTLTYAQLEKICHQIRHVSGHPSGYQLSHGKPGIYSRLRRHVCGHFPFHREKAQVSGEAV